MTKLPVSVVVGCDVNGLGVVRSLGSCGISVVVADCKPSHPSMRTRYAQKTIFPSLGGESVIESLVQLRERFDQAPVLFLTQEKTVEAVSLHRHRLEGLYRFEMPPHAVMSALMQKPGIQALAERGGFPIPRAIHVRCAEDLAQAASLTFPCVLKPTCRNPAYDSRFKKAYKVAGLAELERLCGEILPIMPDLIVQEWIEGGDDSIYFCLQYRSEQKVVASFVGRKLRSWPPQVGGTASCMPAPEHAAELEELTDRFFSAVGFFGMGSVEYKRDVRTGRFMIVEPTVGRTNFQEEVATLNGANIPLAAYARWTGQAPVPATRRGRPVVWAVRALDRWSAELQPDRPVVVPAEARSQDAYWRFDDPLPWLFSAIDRVQQRLQMRRRPT